MRPLEILIVLLILVALVLVYRPAPWHQRWVALVPTAIVVLTFAHLLLEHYRWQMVPAYVLTAGLFVRTLPRLGHPSGRPAARGAGTVLAGGCAGVGWLLALALPLLLPVPRVPTPPGPYAVGSVLYDWTDPTRAERYASDPQAKRELMVQLWYPAQPDAAATPMPLLDHADVALPALAQTLGLPAFALDHLRLIHTHTYSDVPLRPAGAPYPVVVVSHGYTGYRDEAITQMEALASAGYIAVAIDHPYAAAFTVFANGRLVVNDPQMLPPAGRNQPGDQAQREQLAAVVSADQRFVLDQLQLLNAGQGDARFAGQLDLQRIGLMGLSLGGGGVVWTCQVDPRCKVGLAMDGWYEPLPQPLLAAPLGQPFMFMQSATTMWKMDNLARLDHLYQAVTAPAYHLTFAGVLHRDFSDYPLLTPLSAPWMSERGTLNGARTVAVINAYMLAFFDQYLQRRPAALLQGPAREYPEVQFAAHAP